MVVEVRTATAATALAAAAAGQWQDDARRREQPDGRRRRGRQQHPTHAVGCVILIVYFGRHVSGRGRPLVHIEAVPERLAREQCLAVVVEAEAHQVVADRTTWVASSRLLSDRMIVSAVEDVSWRLGLDDPQREVDVLTSQ